MGFGPTLDWPVVRAVEAADAEAAVSAAQAMLAEEPHCDRIEIWTGGRRQQIVRRKA